MTGPADPPRLLRTDSSLTPMQKVPPRTVFGHAKALLRPMSPKYEKKSLERHSRLDYNRT
jgi:hypothetical protein